VLARLDQPVGERLRDEVELDELASARQLLVVLLGAAVQAKQHYIIIMVLEGPVDRA